MKSLLLLLFLGLGLNAQAAGPFLVSDPYTLQSDPNLNPVNFVINFLINGTAASPVAITATTLSNGQIILQYDLATLAAGHYTVTADAVNVFGGVSADSAPFPFTKGVPAPPANLRISPVLLTWVPAFLRTPKTSSPTPLRKPLAPSFS